MLKIPKFGERAQFWRYKLFTSKRQRRWDITRKRWERAGISQGHSNWTGPFYFDEPVDSNFVREWIRSHLGLNQTEHIGVKISLSIAKNSIAMNSHYKQLKIKTL